MATRILPVLICHEHRTAFDDVDADESILGVQTQQATAQAAFERWDSDKQVAA